MFGYMTDLGTVEEKTEETIEAEADNIHTLLFKFLDEFLFLFCAEPFFIARRVEITEIDLENFKIKAKGYGETFDLDKHPQVRNRFHLVRKSSRFHFVRRSSVIRRDLMFKQNFKFESLNPNL